MYCGYILHLHLVAWLLGSVQATSEAAEKQILSLKSLYSYAFCQTS
jgi:hypothetical protein